MNTPVNPSFTIEKSGVRGSSLHGLVFVMFKIIVFYATNSIQFLRHVIAFATELGTFRDLHYANTPMQCTAIFHGCKNVTFQMIFLKYFSYFCSKH